MFFLNFIVSHGGELKGGGEMGMIFSQTQPPGYIKALHENEQ